MSITDENAPKIQQIIPAPADLWVKERFIVDGKPEDSERRVVCLALVESDDMQSIEPMVCWTEDWIDYAESGHGCFFKEGGTENA